MIEIDQWQNCYDDGWQGDIVPEAFSHPAKFSRGLIHRIYLHAKEMGWVKIGDWVLDPFGGVGLGGLDALGMGLNWVGIELEEKFVKLGEQNIELWNHQLKGWPNLGTARLIQGDSRKLKAALEKADILVSSPPFLTETEGQGLNINKPKSFRGVLKNGNLGMGHTPGQLANLKEGKFEMVVGSPPYAESLKPETEEQTTKKQKRIAKSKTIYDGRKLEVPSPGKAGLGGGYGTNPKNLGSMKEGDFDLCISSPSYAEIPIEQTHMTSNKRGDPQNSNYRPSWKRKLADGYAYTKRPYGKSKGQLGDLPEGSFDLCVISPPYEEGIGHNKTPTEIDKKKALHIAGQYGKNKNNLGHQTGDTFWSASREIVQQCFDLLKPKGHAIWVCKDYVKNKKRIPFSDRWLALCESVGFRLVCRHQAMLKKEYDQVHWINEQIKSIKERKSFFRRNAEDKAVAERFWRKIDTQIQNEYIKKARVFVTCKPTEKKIIQKAQTLLWKDFLKPVEEIETRIDWEDVICLVKQ